MLATRIIPTVLCRGRTAVKGSQFNSWRSVGNVAQAVRVHAARGCDELCLLDIGANPENRGPDLALIEELAEVMTTPLAVGGGIRTVEDVRQLLRHGADKVVICTEALARPEFITECANAVGSQAIVIAIDVTPGAIYYALAWGGTKTGPDPFMSAIEIAERAAYLGAGEIILTATDREGMLQGYDTHLVALVASRVGIPVIAHGGCGSPQHMLEAIQAGANAVAAGAMFQFTDWTPASCAKYLSEHGVDVRLAA